MNVEVQPVMNALIRLGIERDRIVAIDGDDACATYTLALEENFEPRWTYEGPFDRGNAKLGIGRSSQVVEAAIDGCNGAEADGIVELTVRDVGSRDGDDVAVTLGEFLRAAGGHSQPRARLLWPNGDKSYVANTESAAYGSRHEGWLILQPTAADLPA